MDFDVTPETNTYPSYPRMTGSSDLSGGMNSGSLDPTVYAGAETGTDGEKKKGPNLFLFGAIAVIALTTIITIGFFMYLNSQGAHADTNEQDITLGEELAESRPRIRATQGPSPTLVLPTIPRSPTPTPIGVTNIPTPTIHRSDLNNALIAMSGTPVQARNKWEIIFTKGTYSSRDFSGSAVKKVTGTLFTPIAKGKMVCIAADQTFFNRKVSETTIARLCDENTPTPVTRRLNCTPYNPATGIQVSAELFPGDSCDDPNATVAVGETYVMAVRVWYNCKGNQQASTVPESWCEDSREVFSYDLTYTN
ncbi:MAG: hypothetical protein N2691_02275 [Patescibacteria group bacterium]|nr:hypothetical protein [Patescibacteria group bacterium]